MKFFKVNYFIVSLIAGVLLDIIGWIKGVEYNSLAKINFMLVSLLLYDYSLWRIKNK